MSGLGRSALVVGVSLMATACGKKGALIYPDMLVPAAPSAVSARQSGSAVKLSFILPDKDRAGRPVRDLAGLKISRKTAEAEQKNVCRSCMADYSLFRTLYLDHLKPNTQRFGNLVMSLDGDVSVGNSYSYSIVPFTADGVDGAPSTTAAVRVVMPLPAPLLKIESHPTEVRLQMSSQSATVGNLLGYNLYRWSAAVPKPYFPLNREVLKNAEYVDVGLERGVRYRYSARALYTLPSGDIVESTESNEVEGVLADDEE
ncbi:MAG: hypothetical protein PHR66_08340 [Desulfuromonadaceae bacterium]|nr:hypothetical protein [Desulfuromonadaceae bacterium]